MNIVKLNCCELLYFLFSDFTTAPPPSPAGFPYTPTPHPTPPPAQLLYLSEIFEVK